MITLVSYPTGWVAGHTNNKFNFLRQDYTVISVTMSGSYISVQVGELYLSSDMVGTYVYLNCLPYAGSYEVLSVTSYVVGGKTNYRMTLNASFIGYGYNGSFNSNYMKAEHSVDLQLYNGNTLITTLNGTSFTDGTLSIDASTAIRAVLRDYKFPSTMTERNKASDAYFKLYFKYREKYTGYTGAYSALTFACNCLNAVKQLGDLNGSSMVGYEPSYESFVVESNGLFLQGFDEPRMNVNSFYELNFIWDGGDFANFAATLKVRFLDLNKSVISTYTEQLSQTTSGSLTRVRIDNLSIPSNCEYLAASIEVGDTELHYVATGYVKSGYVK